MSRKRVEMNLYNKDIKEQFLDKECKTEKTRNAYRKTLHRTSKYERMYGRDLYDFTQVQYIKMMIDMNIKSINSVIKEWSIYSKYCSWAKECGYKKSPDVEFTKEDLQELVNADAMQNQYIHSFDELTDIMDSCINAQDAVLLGLLFVGVRGRASEDCTFEEILNLQKEDVDFTNNVITARRNDRTTRKIEHVHQKIMNVLKGAIEQEIYYFKNGDAEHRIDKMALLQNDFIIRPISRKRLAGQEHIDVTSVNGRIKEIAQRIGKQISPRTVFQSGMLNKTKELEEQKGELTPDDYRELCTRFGMEEERWYKVKQMHIDYREKMKRKG